jgi:hypothetical protein
MCAERGIQHEYTLKLSILGVATLASWSSISGTCQHGVLRRCVIPHRWVYRCMACQHGVRAQSGAPGPEKAYRLAVLCVRAGHVRWRKVQFRLRVSERWTHRSLTSHDPVRSGDSSQFADGFGLPSVRLYEHRVGPRPRPSTYPRMSLICVYVPVCE